MKSTFPIHKGGTSGIITLPKSFQKYGEINQVKFGSAYAPCTVHFSDMKEMLISTDIFQQLHLPFESSSHIFVHEKTLYIAPLIAIFTAGFTDCPLEPLGDRTSFFAEFLKSSQNIAYGFVFGGHGINWKEGTIKGYFYVNNHWHLREVPFPNVVYDRLPNRKTENHPTMKKIKERLQNQYDILWFNARFFHKWEIHQALQKVQEVEEFLPETELFTSTNQVRRFLAKYEHIYMKATNGSLGSHIYQIFQEGNAYYCRFYKDNEPKLRKYVSLEHLINRVTEKEEFIVQQGISLHTYQQRPVDFRVHATKNRRGEFEITAIAGKIAGQGSMTTHVGLGGEMKSVDEIFPSGDIAKKLTSMALLIAKVIDRAVTGFIGEIGFDLGVDKEGKIWFFEANSRPGRTIFHYPNLKQYKHKSLEFFTAYSTFLIEKSVGKT